MFKRFSFWLILAILSLFVGFSCSKITTPAAIFKKQSPHDAYGQRLKDAGLDRTELGGAWLLAADESVAKALDITVPYKETGYFSADKIQTSTLVFSLKRGASIHIALSKKPETNCHIYIDLMLLNATNQVKTVASADTEGVRLDYEVGQTGKYILRLQPELLRGGEYTLTITNGPSLSYPVAPSGKPHVGSVFGDSRDEGGRKHEGIDIFAPKGTPALAAADGVIVNVADNKLGGKIVLLHPDGKDYSLYYAHLEVQLVKPGQKVRVNDTVGLIDNTGNAKNTPTHLHFGIYAPEGAVDPLPFVNREIRLPHPISANTDMLNAGARTNTASKLYLSPGTAHEEQILPLHTIVTVNAATGNYYKVVLPNGRTGYVNSNVVSRTTSLRAVKLKRPEPLFDSPDTAAAARKTTLDAATTLKVLGGFNNYLLVSDEEGNSGWLSQSVL